MAPEAVGREKKKWPWPVPKTNKLRLLHLKDASQNKKGKQGLLKSR